MNNIYIATVSTNDKWEICPGTYLVIADNVEHATENLDAYLTLNCDDFIIKSFEFYDITEKEDGVLMIQCMH
jgi:hypothetical protein